MSVQLASSWSFGSGRIVHHFLRKILLVPRQMSGDSKALCMVTVVVVVGKHYNWTSWRTAHNSRLSTDHPEKSICEVIKAVPQATLEYVHSNPQFQDVSICFKQHRDTQFSDGKLGRLSCKHFEPGIFGDLNRLCSTDLHSHPSQPLGPENFEAVVGTWYPPSQGIAIISASSGFLSASLHKNDRKDQVMV